MCRQRLVGDQMAETRSSLIVLPLMLFHQMQLMVCASLARRYASRPLPAAAG